MCIFLNFVSTFFPNPFFPVSGRQEYGGVLPLCACEPAGAARVVGKRRRDLINFECEDIKDLETEFHEAVDAYLEFCEEVGKEPEKEYRGTFNVRISPELHKKLAITAMKNGDTLNTSVEKAISEYVQSSFV